MKFTLFLIFTVLCYGNVFTQQLNYQTHEFEYDELNRLKRVIFSNGTIYDYTYDNLGNRTGRNVSQIQLTYVPDDAFEQELINLGYDNIMDDYVRTDNISSLTYLWVNDLGISDFTGIEDFTSLEILHCASNLLTGIDLSQNVNLKELYCTHNNLQELDISNNPNLLHLQCYNNEILTLDLSNNLLLESIGCGNNPITHIDLSQHTHIQWFESLNGQLETLNVKNGNNSIISYLYTINNPNLYCIQVDDEVAANNGTGVYAGWIVDTQVEYSEDCVYLGVTDHELEGISLYPNPTNNTLFLSLPKYVDTNVNFSLIDINGKLIKQNLVIVENMNLNIDVSFLPSGTYIIQLLIDNLTWSSNFIKK